MKLTQDHANVSVNGATPSPAKRPRTSQACGSATAAAAHGRSVEHERRQLPVYQLRTRLLHELRGRSTVVLIGETGSGKSTQLPQLCLSRELTQTTGHHPATAGDAAVTVAVTQPRRVAAISLAQRVSEEMHSLLGHTVGYSVRFEQCCCAATRIKYLTDGMLLRETMHDRLLRRYLYIILDEAHERTVQTDVLFGVLKKIQKLRRFRQLPELRLIVMSATMDVDHISRYFNHAHVVYLEGRQYPVQVFYSRQSHEDRVFAALCTLVQLHRTAPANHDMLMFLTGQHEIDTMVANVRQLASEVGAVRLRVVPLYASLPLHHQMSVFERTPAGQRKLVVATNIAETSVTLPNIKYVIDCGLVKTRYYQSGTGMEMLKVQFISQSQAWQRTGRAGRESDGYCYRVYTRQEFDEMSVDSVPEIRRCNLTGVCLQMISVGVKNVHNFDFIDRPQTESLDDAMAELVLLEAVSRVPPVSPSLSLSSSAAASDNNNWQLTEMGRQMACLPLHPKFARAILASKHYHCTEQVVSVVAMLSAENVLVTPAAAAAGQHDHVVAARRSFMSADGDLATLLNIYRAYVKVNRNKEWCEQNLVHVRHMAHADNIRRQLLQVCHNMQLPVGSSGGGDGGDGTAGGLVRSMCAGLFMSSAQLTKQGHLVTVSSGEKVEIHPSSVLFQSRPTCVLYTELVHTSKKYIRGLCAVDPRCLKEVAPDYFKKHRLINVT